MAVDGGRGVPASRGLAGHRSEGPGPETGTWRGSVDSYTDEEEDPMDIEYAMTVGATRYSEALDVLGRYGRADDRRRRRRPRSAGRG